MVLVFLMLTPVGYTGPLGTYLYLPSALAKSAGLILVAAGLALAIWARTVLGSNWSGVPSVKEGQTLTTNGPYSAVRHPIYTGLLFGVLGSFAVLGTLFSAVVVVAWVVVVAIRIPQEESFMTEEFGDAYKDYKKKAKTLIPWVW